jgi:hypothetical protein
MYEISVRMKRGGRMILLADGRVYKDSDGAGQKFTSLDDLRLYWPKKSKNGKLYPVKDEFVANMKEAEEDFIEAVIADAQTLDEEAAERRAEALELKLDGRD